MATNIISLGITSEIRLDNASSYGSVGGTTRTFVNVTVLKGKSISLVQSAIDGDSFLIEKTGVYSIDYHDNFNTASNMAITVNSSSTAMGPLSLPNEQVLAVELSTAANRMVSISGTMGLKKGDIVRAQTDGAPGGTNDYAMFKITQVG